jgi:Skp family chaperone for outer membrane proteins
MRRFRFFQPRLVIALVGALSGAPAAAQSFGPPIAGVCLFGRSDALEKSARGKEIAARIARAENALSEKVAGDRARIQAEAAHLDGRDSRRVAQQQLLAIVDQYEKDVQARIKMQSALGYAVIEPVMVAALSQVITEKRCSLIVERSITYGWNNGMDITDIVISRIDATS